MGWDYWTQQRSTSTTHHHRYPGYPVNARAHAHAGMTTNFPPGMISVRVSPSSKSYPTSASTTELQSSPSCYSTVQDDNFHPEYEEPENFYESPPIVAKKNPSPSASPPPLPPPLQTTTLTKLVPQKSQSHCHRSRKTTRCGKELRVIVPVLICLSLLCIGAAFGYLWHAQRQLPRRPEATAMAMDARSAANVDVKGAESESSRKHGGIVHKTVEPLISANTLLTHLITKRKLCLFEVGTLQAEESRNDFREEHIESSRLLFFNNLSHSGVPVHPLQFQRYVRNLGVDHDCYVVLYDKGEQIWSSYAFWIFKLFGHERVSLLNGGFPEWKRLQTSSIGVYPTSTGTGSPPAAIGNFQSMWIADYISSFDDVMANFRTKEHDLVDSQSPEEFAGIAHGAIFGHIRNAINLPPEEIFDAMNNTWIEAEDMARIFAEHGLQPERPVIVYCGTSLHASMLWVALHRLKYSTSIYFGSWPEWVIRAPDHMKVIPEDNALVPSSTENLRTTPEILAPRSN